MYAWEQILGSRVSIARERELHELHKVALLDASQTVLWALAPFCVSCCVVSMYTEGQQVSVRSGTSLA